MDRCDKCGSSIEPIKPNVIRVIIDDWKVWLIGQNEPVQRIDRLHPSDTVTIQHPDNQWDVRIEWEQS